MQTIIKIYLTGSSIGLFSILGLIYFKLKTSLRSNSGGAIKKQMTNYIISKKLLKIYNDLSKIRSLFLENKDDNETENVLENFEFIKLSCPNTLSLYNEKKQNEFEEYVLWNRKNPKIDVEIFNIFGHTPTKYIDTSKHFINVDTGCYIKNKSGYGKLSAYCVQTNEIISENFQL